MREVVKQTNLFFTEGNSDKQYTAWLYRVDGGFSVEFAFGRRGSALKHGKKTEAPVDEAKAQKVFDALVASKAKKGYTEDESGEVFSSGELSERKTVFRPHLLTATDEAEGRRLLLCSPDYLAQVKHDGERRYLSLENGKVTGANRQGLEVPVRSNIAQNMMAYQDAGIEQIELDCEDMGEYVMAFDILSLNGRNLRGEAFAARYEILKNTMEKIDCKRFHSIRLSVALYCAGLDDVYIAQCKANKEEGYVLKHIAGKYVDGARNNDQLKVKFWKNATVRVREAHTTKRSVSTEVRRADGSWQEVGNVTIPANVSAIPAAGTLISVRYLYAYEQGSLYQPTFERVRSDQTEQDACIDQLEYKKAA